MTVRWRGRATFQLEVHGEPADARTITGPAPTAEEAHSFAREWLEELEVDEAVEAGRVYTLGYGVSL